LRGIGIENFGDFLKRSQRLLKPLGSRSSDIMECIIAYKFRGKFRGSADIPMRVSSDQQQALIPGAKGVLQIVADFFVGGLKVGKIAEASEIFEGSQCFLSAIEVRVSYPMAE
jgi:hypothetical protein